LPISNIEIFILSTLSSLMPEIGAIIYLLYGSCSSNVLKKFLDISS